MKKELQGKLVALMRGRGVLLVDEMCVKTYPPFIDRQTTCLYRSFQIFGQGSFRYQKHRIFL